jgi:hypothetical protein
MSGLRPSHSECLHGVPRFKGPQRGLVLFQIFSKYILYQNYCFSIRTGSSGPCVGEVTKFILHWDRKCLKLALQPATTLRNFALRHKVCIRVSNNSRIYDYFPQYDLPTGMHNGYGLCCEAGTVFLHLRKLPCLLHV